MTYRCDKCKSKNDPCDCIDHSYVEGLENQIQELKEEIENLKCQILSTSDTCPNCGCTEFLCGHNAKG